MPDSGLEKMKIALLGWGSLLWDEHPEFDKHRNSWEEDGPQLNIEFCRVSKTRNHALTLVLDTKYGAPYKVSYSLSKRNTLEDAISDLRCREGTPWKNIGYCVANSAQKNACDEGVEKTIRNWVSEQEFDAAVWTDLKNNFKEESKFGKPFSISNALDHIQALDPIGKSKAAEYVWRAPSLVVTPLREALQAHCLLLGDAKSESRAASGRKLLPLKR